jgi:hypothetical protein
MKFKNRLFASIAMVLILSLPALAGVLPNDNKQGGRSGEMPTGRPNVVQQADISIFEWISDIFVELYGVVVGD